MGKSTKFAIETSRNVDPTQSERFKEAASELGADESEERFNAALGKVARHKPKADETSKEEEQDDERD